MTRTTTVITTTAAHGETSFQETEQAGAAGVSRSRRSAASSEQRRARQSLTPVKADADRLLNTPQSVLRNGKRYGAKWKTSEGLSVVLVGLIVLCLASIGGVWLFS